MSLSFYRVDPDYCDYLRQFDKCVSYTSNDKQTRPFIGILLTVNNTDYYAPLSSPKPKHMNMKNQLDFMRIDEGKLGAINFNNMIPIHESLLSKLDIRALPSDSKETSNYKNMLANQLSWCNSHSNSILRNAEKIHNVISTGRAFDSLKKRCCNFPLLEQKAAEYHAQYIQSKEAAQDISPAKPIAKSGIGFER